ncbi:unnamed protein product [Trichobilharzia szidati]|nr:unnamed protein product [Trichobilharzia szidati]
MVNKENSIFSFLPTIWKSDENKTFCKHDDLLHGLKLSVKTLMEHAAVCRSVPEDSTVVIDFCEIVHECLRIGLKTSPIPFSQCPSTFSILYKISHQCEAASTVIDKFMKYKNNTNNNNCNNTTNNKSHAETKTGTNIHRSQSSGPTNRTGDKLHLGNIIFHHVDKRNKIYERKSLTGKKLCPKLSYNSKIAWIHFALIERLLESIVRHICKEAKDLYNSDSIIANECEVNVFLSLLSGPCAISYTTTIHEDYYWSNLHADELIERQRFTSITTQNQIIGRSSQVCQKTKSCFPESYKSVEQKFEKLTRIGNSSSLSDSSFTDNSVDSLYQTRKSTLLYGKNNVMLGDEQRAPGYLELINSSNDILIRWTSNELLLQASDIKSYRCHTGEQDSEKSLLDDQLEKLSNTESTNTDEHSSMSNPPEDNNTRIDKYRTIQYDVVTISVNKIEYVHLHRGGSHEYRIIFIGLDGIAYPPVGLQGGLKAVYDFLVCLDNGLKPNACLNPSPNDLGVIKTDDMKCMKANDKQQLTTSILWSLIDFRSKLNESNNNSNNISGNDDGNAGNQSLELANESDENKEETKSSIMKTANLKSSSLSHSKDVEFIFKIFRSEIVTDTCDEVFSKQKNKRHLRSKSHTRDESKIVVETVIEEQSTSLQNESMSSMDIVDTIKVQLMLKTFRSWLVYTRHMKNVRKLLSPLVIHSDIMLSDSLKQQQQCEELTRDKWCELFLNIPDKQNFNPNCIYECIYFGGCASELRNEVWPYLLGVYNWSMNETEKNQIDQQLREHYNTKLKEWMKLEEIILRTEEKCTTNPSTISQSSECQLEKDSSENFSDYNESIMKQFAHALESVKKDVVRCDRNNCFYSKLDSHGERNLATIQRILLTYVWEFLDDEYTQGMCDIVAPLLVLKSSSYSSSQSQATEMHLSSTISKTTKTTEEEEKNEILSNKECEKKKKRNEISNEIEVGTYVLFKQIMNNRMKKLFSRDTATLYMDEKFDHIKSLIQILDPQLISHLQKFSDFTHFYFCYRWFLLDFKREFKYQDVFRIWEVILCAEHLISKDFSLFIALALIQNYRDVISANHMEFTDILKFFNERAENHDVQNILNLARHFAATVQMLTSKTNEN